MPGNPDMVFPKRGKIIFVHGCFSHRSLRNLGWEVLVAWECQLKNLEKTAERIERFMNGAMTEQ
jgi:DNA mismatch endonuclease (patch repair protein)